MSICQGCDINYFECIAKFYKKDEESVAFLRNHGVLPSQVTCPKCDNPTAFREDQSLWRCRYRWLVPKTKKRRHCEFSVSDYKDTFLSNTNLPPWKVILFVNHWLSRLWDHSTVVECLKVSLATSYEWHSFCCQVTDHWFENQPSIGGPDSVVEIDKALIVHKKYVKGGPPSQVWLFGGVERGTKQRFTVPLAEPVGEWQEHSNVLPLIKRFIRTGSLIVSDQWVAYHSLKEHGYTHHVINHSKLPANSEVHIRNIEALWKELGNWVKRPHSRVSSLHQDLARYLFIKSCDSNHECIHKLFVNAGRLFPHQGGHRHLPPPVSKETFEEEIKEY